VQVEALRRNIEEKKTEELLLVAEMEKVLRTPCPTHLV